jgi:hypothetical protein
MRKKDNKIKIPKDQLSDFYSHNSQGGRDSQDLVYEDENRKD